MTAQNPFNVNNRFRWTASELAMGRIMRAPDDHPGAPPGFQTGDGNGEQSQNNNNENRDQSQDQNRDNNNTGDDDFDAVAFWSGADENDASPSRSDSADSSARSAPTGGNGNRDESQQQQPNLGQTLLSEIEGFTADDLFTGEIAEQINQGNFEGANKVLTTNLQKAMRTSLNQQARLLREFGGIITRQVQQMISESMTGQQNADYLVQKIPSAASKKVGPAIRAIYDQALINAKGDRAKAVQMTKSMMGTLASEMANDLDIDVAPRDPHATRAPRPVNWLQELAGRE